MQRIEPATWNRIRTAVKGWEQQSGNLNSTPVNRRQHEDVFSCWAILTTTADEDGFYSWQRVIPDGDGGYQLDGDEQDHTAWEINSNEDIEPDTIVLLSWFGYSTDGNSQWIFSRACRCPEQEES